MRSLGGVLIQFNWCPQKGGNLDTGTQPGRPSSGNKDIYGMTLIQVKEPPKTAGNPLEATKESWNRSSFQCSEGTNVANPSIWRF